MATTDCCEPTPTDLLEVEKARALETSQAHPKRIRGVMLAIAAGALGALGAAIGRGSEGLSDAAGPWRSVARLLLVGLLLFVNSSGVCL